MVDITLSSLLTTTPVTEDVSGDEPLETVASSVSKAFKVRQLSVTPIRTIVSSSTLLIEDQGKVLILNSSSDISITIPLNSVVGFNIGTTILIRRGSLGGEVSIALEGGVTMEKRVSLSFNLAEIQSQCVLHKIGTNTWFMTGEMNPT